MPSTLNDILNPLASQIYEYYQYLSLLITLFLYPITFYVILKKSPKSFGFYKWLLFAEESILCLYNVIMTVWRPSMLTPYTMGKILKKFPFFKIFTEFKKFKSSKNSVFL